MTMTTRPASPDTGVCVNTPMNQRPGIIPPTGENFDRIAREAEAKRQRTMSTQEFGAQYGIPREFALFVQRLEARVIQLERDNNDLRERVAKLERPAHMRGVETR